MKVTRRQFLQTVATSAVALGLSQLQVLKFAEVLAKKDGPVEVIWLQGQNCTGCTTSFAGLEWDGNPEALAGDVRKLLNAPDTDIHAGPFAATLPAVYSVDGKTTIDDVLLDIIDLKYNSTIMATAGEAADALLRGWMTTGPAGGVTRILIVEGSIPTNALGKYCTISSTLAGSELTVADAVAGIAANSGLVIAIGACATYGGIPAALSDPTMPKTGAMDVKTFLKTTPASGKTVVNVPGCPINPDWLFGTIVHYLLHNFDGGANLDTYGRPTYYYGQTNHGGRCPRYQAYCDGMFALTPGEAPNENNRKFTAGLPSTGTATGRELNAPYNIPLCLEKLGCKGFSTGADCAFGGPGGGMKGRGWNVSARGVDLNPAVSSGNSCINNGHPCTGCTEKGYPDKFSPFYTY